MTDPVEKPESQEPATPPKPRRAIPPVPPKAPRPGTATRPGTASDAGTGTGADQADKPKPDPTRYGDWEKNGRCIDF